MSKLAATSRALASMPKLSSLAPDLPSHPYRTARRHPACKGRKSDLVVRDGMARGADRRAILPAPLRSSLRKIPQEFRAAKPSSEQIFARVQQLSGDSPIDPSRPKVGAPQQNSLTFPEVSAYSRR